MFITAVIVNMKINSYTQKTHSISSLSGLLSHHNKHSRATSFNLFALVLHQAVAPNYVYELQKALTLAGIICQKKIKKIKKFPWSTRRVCKLFCITRPCF